MSPPEGGSHALSDVYVVAVRRDRRDQVPTDWTERLASVDGVRVLGASGTRAQLEVDEGALENVSSALGSNFLIEPVIEHRPSRHIAS